METQISFILMEIVRVILSTFLAIITGLLMAATPVIIQTVLGYFKARDAELQAGANAEQYILIRNVIIEAIQSTEQKAKIGEIAKQARVMKETALAIAEREITRLGIPFDLISAADAIEAAINQGLHKPSAFTPVVREIQDLADGLTEVQVETNVGVFTPAILVGDTPVSQ